MNTLKAKVINGRWELRLAPLDELLAPYLEGLAGELALDRQPFSPDDFRGWFRRRTGETLEPPCSDGAPGLLLSARDEPFLDALACHVERLRRRHFHAVCLRFLREAGRVLVVCGQGHYELLRASLTRAGVGADVRMAGD